MTIDAGIAALVASLSIRDRLSADELLAVRSLPWRTRSYSRGMEIVPDRSRPTESCLQASGLAARTVLLRNGSRQITAVHIAGDFVDLHSMLIKKMDHAVAALTDCHVLFVDHGELERLSRSHPHLWRLLSVLVAVDSAIQRAWMVGLGRRNPVSHLAHLICELYMRQEAVGVARDLTFDFRVGQAELADMLGLSVVHTNRTLQELRATDTISWRNGLMHIHDFAALAKLGDFDPLYLNLFSEPR